jgi:opacity protein-like surface antigen
MPVQLLRETTSRGIACCGLVLLIAMLTPATAQAQGFVSPSIGFNFGSQFADCHSVSDCQTHHVGYGVGLGYLGTLFGFEEELTYTPTFFGSSSASSTNSVTTLMSSLLVALPLGPVHPYGTIGLGSIRTSADFNLVDTVHFRDSGLGWVIGGGLMIFPTEHIGVRGDIRHFRGAHNLDLPGLSISGSPMDFSRASASLVFRF